MLNKTNAADFFTKNNIHNFHPKDFACECCGDLKLDENLVCAAQILRDRTELPMLISSGYRCQAYNDTLRNSVKRSQHVQGKAFDLSIAPYSSEELYRLLKSAFASDLFNGIGIDLHFIHFDIKTGNKRLWIYQ